MRIGIGITTYKRPDYFEDCINSVIKHLLPLVDVVAVYNDGSKLKDYQSIYDGLPKQVWVEHKNKNQGVAHAKNWLLKKMMREDCDYMFLLEDDLIIKHPKAVFQYIKVAKETGIGHMMFAHHGPMNVNGLIHSDENGIELYPHCVGAWCMYTKESIEAVGYFDENFKNSYEHVEHTFRLAKKGFTVEWSYFADVKGSKDWIEEQPEAIENTSIEKTKEWAINSIKGLYYWRAKDPDFPLTETIKRIEKERT